MSAHDNVTGPGPLPPHADRTGLPPVHEQATVLRLKPNWHPYSTAFDGHPVGTRVWRPSTDTYGIFEGVSGLNAPLIRWDGDDHSTPINDLDQIEDIKIRLAGECR